MIRVRRDTARHKLTVVTGGVTTVYYPDLTPGVTIYYTPGVSGSAPVAVPRYYADLTANQYADLTAMEYAA